MRGKYFKIRGAGGEDAGGGSYNRPGGVGGCDETYTWCGGELFMLVYEVGVC